MYASEISHMISLKDESIDFLNEGHFKIKDPGPLHSPVYGFSVRRDDKLALLLETEAASNAKSTAARHPTGTTLLNTERVELVNISGVGAVLSGVQAYSVRTLYNYQRLSVLQELARVHQLTITLGDVRTAAYSIEWLENLPAGPFVWPDSIQIVTEKVVTHSIALTNNGITITGLDRRDSSSQAAAKITVADDTFYVCALGLDEPGAEIKPGCIVYAGVPDDRARKKIRTALSFALGVYLVEMGHTIYDKEWHIVSTTSQSAYSLGKKSIRSCTRAAGAL
jgi:hypothetical protein